MAWIIKNSRESKNLEVTIHAVFSPQNHFLTLGAGCWKSKKKLLHWWNIAFHGLIYKTKGTMLLGLEFIYLKSQSLCLNRIFGKEVCVWYSEKHQELNALQLWHASGSLFSRCLWRGHTTSGGSNNRSRVSFSWENQSNWECYISHY